MASPLHLFTFFRLLFLLASFHFIVINTSSSVQPLCHDNESFALIQFKQSISIVKFASDDPSAYPKVLSWKPEGESNSSSDCCSWDGITCHGDTGHVIGLDLSSSLLFGSINSSSSLFQLVHLRRLNLADNDFNDSQIPSDVGLLSRLTYLNLSYSVFVGQIPLEISQLNKLVSLDLSRNSLKLQKPGLASLVRNLTDLKELHLSQVNIPSVVPKILVNFSSLTSLLLEECGLHGEFPAGIFQLPNLQFLRVQYNQQLIGYLPEFHRRSPLKVLKLAGTSFSGELPNSIGNLDSLNQLDIQQCSFSGSIPSSIGNLAQLLYLDLSGNNFSGGSIPSSIGNLSQLLYLDLSGNNFSTGSIPSSIGNLAQLRHLQLSGNNFSAGSIPYSIGNLAQLFYLGLSRNNFSRGSIPSSIGNLAQLRHLDLSRNNFSAGSIPSSIGNLAQLRHLQLSGNNFSAGSIPSSIGNLAQLRHLQLSGNNFSAGSIPSSIGNLAQLRHLQLSGNNFSAGSIPSSIGNLAQLRHLQLSGNNFSAGSIPSSIGNLAQLRHLQLSGNNFSAGSIPYSIGNLAQLLSLDLSGNFLGGSIPSSIGNLSQLLYLDLSGNNFSAGSIPSSIGNLAQLDTLHMSSSQLTGQIPSSLMNMTQLTLLDLSHNLLHGPILESISQLVNLQALYMNGNDLSGRLKLDVFLALKNLTHLQLSHNRLTLLSDSNYINATLPKFHYLELASCNLIEFPDFLKTQNDLELLDLSNNRIQGSLSTWIWNMSKGLFEGNLSQNFITGFHQQPLVLPWLLILDLSSNMLRGSLPVPPLSTVVYNVANNSLTGEIPLQLCNVSSLEVLDLSYNNLSGIIPQCLGWFADSLTLLNLQNNKLRGPIPQTYRNGTELRMINLSQNQLQGPVPRSLVNCLFLESLDLGNNQINDIFPFWLGTLSELKVLLLPFNRFHGEIWKPNSSFAFPMLHVLDLSHNGFSGKLPSNYFHTWTAMKTIDHVNQLIYILRAESLFETYSVYTMTLINKGVQITYLHILDIFAAIDLSSNRFEGDIPESIGILKCLHMLNLSNNNLIGQIPSSLGNLTELESLDLSQNKLLGEIPLQLTQLNFLEIFDVSHNNLRGPIPRGRQFDTFQNSSYEGNSGLCGDPLSKKCGNLEAPLPLPLSNFKQDDNHSWFPIDKSDWIVMCMGYGGGLAVGLIIGHTLTTRYHEWFVSTFRRNQKNQRMKNKSVRRS